MPTSLSSTLTAKTSWTYTNAKDLGDVSQSGSTNYVKNLANGTSNDQNDLVYSAKLTISASGNTTLDLAAGVVNEFGVTLTFVEVTAVYVDLDPGETAQASSVTVGDATAPVPLGFLGTTPRWTVNQGGVFFVANPTAGWPVTATSADGLKIANNDATNSAKVKVVIMGRSA